MKIPAGEEEETKPQRAVDFEAFVRPITVTPDQATTSKSQPRHWTEKAPQISAIYFYR